MVGQTPYLVDRISALGIVTEEVACQDDSGDMGGTTLFSFVPKLPRHHIHQQLGAQEALAATSAQAQPGYQQHKSAEDGEVLQVAARGRRFLPTETLGCPSAAPHLSVSSGGIGFWGARSAKQWSST